MAIERTPTSISGDRGILGDLDAMRLARDAIGRLNVRDLARLSEKGEALRAAHAALSDRLRGA